MGSRSACCWEMPENIPGPPYILLLCKPRCHARASAARTPHLFTPLSLTHTMNALLQDNNAAQNQVSAADSITLGQLKAMVGTVQKPKVRAAVCFASPVRSTGVICAAIPL